MRWPQRSKVGSIVRLAVVQATCELARELLIAAAIGHDAGRRLNQTTRRRLHTCASFLPQHLQNWRQAGMPAHAKSTVVTTMYHAPAEAQKKFGETPFDGRFAQPEFSGATRTRPRQRSWPFGIHQFSESPQLSLRDRPRHRRRPGSPVPFALKQSMFRPFLSINRVRPLGLKLSVDG